MAKFPNLCVLDNAGPNRVDHGVREQAVLRPAARLLQDRPGYVDLVAVTCHG